jgi:hypothetical protein
VPVAASQNSGQGTSGINAKETYYKTKETYYKAKETYCKAKETYSKAKDTSEVTDGHQTQAC